MLKNYLKIAFRQLRRQKMYAAIKIGGFALSIAACLLIALYIRDELSYDTFYAGASRIYRLIGEYNDNGKIGASADWPEPMAKALKDDYPEVELAGRIMPHEVFYGGGSNEIRRTDKTEDSYETGFAYADQEILDILEIPIIDGARKTALTEPMTLVISKREADKFFPGEDPVGKTMMLNDDRNQVYKVSAVMQNFPKNSHLQYDYFLTLAGHSFFNGEKGFWGASNYFTYVRLKPGASAELFRSKLHQILTKYFMAAALAAGDKGWIDAISKFKILAQPIRDVHLRSSYVDDGLENGDIRFVWLFGAIACFILTIAAINFINLSTAKSANRAKEVGLRKVVGSGRIDLIRQFLTESAIFSFTSFLLAILLAALLLPLFNTLAAKTLSIPWTAWWLLPSMILSAAGIGLVAGIYPAFYLSAFKPINVLKGQLSRGSRNSLLRNGLVVFQFATSIMLVISTIVIYNQTHYILNRDSGFNKDQVMLLEGTSTLDSKTSMPSFKNELLAISSVKSVTVSDYLPISGTKRNQTTLFKDGRTKMDVGVSGEYWTVDYDYLKTLGIKLNEGRFFSRDMASDTAAIVINTAMKESLGLKNPIGQMTTNTWDHMRIIGVVDNFNFETMKQSVGPLAFLLGNDNSTMVAVKINPSNVQGTIAAITSVWKKFAPSQPIRYTFLDERFASMYADVQRMGSIFTTFATLAIIIACLGLFALSAFMAQQRNKEIGIRKVLGATITGITTMLSKDFVRLVLIAFLIASPLAWWGMNKWLQDYQYRITIGWWMFAITALLVTFIALVTISFQSIRAAMMNPIESLRSE